MGVQHAFLAAQNSGMDSDQEGALCLQQHCGWDAGSSHPSLSWPERAAPAMAEAEKGKKRAGRPAQLDARRATAQPEGH